ncbi:MAG: histidinol dehydrogenase [Ferruginibacter sp.]
MIEKIKYPSQEMYPDIIQRSVKAERNVSAIVNEIFAAVKQDGDEALKKYALQFDKAQLTELKVSQQEIDASERSVDAKLKKAISLAYKNIYTFHKAQLRKNKKITTVKGVVCWIEARAIEHVGLYIPGGTAPLFSTVLMLGIPAMIAGCKNIMLCTPASEDINPAILYSAKLVGIQNIYKIGGIQAIAALCYGTETIAKADKIFGPGNQYVTAAKMKAQQVGVAIDMPAGPSELLIIADKNAVPSFVAADLLSQVEHGPDSQVILISDNEKMIEETLIELQNQLNVLPRKEFATAALQNSKAILVNNMSEAIELSNVYAPEHLILAVKHANKMLPAIVNAGSVFLGNYSSESAGDYASGTNHCLPTNGFARNYSGVSVDSFQKKISFQKISKKGLQNIGPAIEQMAAAEGLIAHKNAVRIRLMKLGSD